jgi:hypothetical protein
MNLIHLGYPSTVSDRYLLCISSGEAASLEFFVPHFFSHMVPYPLTLDDDASEQKVLPKNLWSANLLPKLWGLLFAPLSDVLCQHLAEASRSKRRLYRYASGSLISHPFTIVLTPYSLLNVPRVLP